MLAENVLATITELNDVVDALQVRAEAFNAKLQALWGVCWKQIPLVVPYEYKQGNEQKGEGETGRQRTVGDLALVPRVVTAEETSVVEDSDGHAPES